MGELNIKALYFVINKNNIFEVIFLNSSDSWPFLRPKGYDLNKR